MFTFRSIFSLINLIQFASTLFLQASEVEKCLSMSSTNQYFTKDNRKQCYLSRYTRNICTKNDGTWEAGKIYYIPKCHLLTEDYAHKINFFINNREKITNYDNMYAIFYDILHLGITKNGIQNFITDYFFIDLLDKIKGSKLHYDLSWLLCSKYLTKEEINDWLKMFFIYIEKNNLNYYQTNESTIEIYSDEKLVRDSYNTDASLFVHFNFNDELPWQLSIFKKGFFDIIEKDCIFWQKNFTTYATISDKNFFLHHNNACIEPFPLVLKKEADNTIDFTLYPIKKARAWLYNSLFYNPRKILENYPFEEKCMARKIGPDIASYCLIFKNIFTIVIDASNLQKLHVKELLHIFPDVQKIVLRNLGKQDTILHSTEAYILLKKMVDLPLKPVLIEITDFPLQLRTKQIIKSFIKFWVIPKDTTDDFGDLCDSGLSIFNIINYFILFSYGISYMTHTEKSLLISIPLAIILFPILSLRTNKRETTWGKYAGPFIGDHQHWTFYAWRQAIIYAINILSLYILTKSKFSVNKNDFLIQIVFVNFFVQSMYLALSYNRLIQCIKVGFLCVKARSFMPYIKNNQSIPT